VRIFSRETSDQIWSKDVMRFEKEKIWVHTLCMKNGFMLTELQLEQLNQYVNLLIDWNKKINLISRRDEENIWTYHILHCISILFKLKLCDGCRIVDIGTGGGLPGIPIKILRPDISLLCLDATRKKTNAVLQMVDELKMNNISIVWGRAEELGRQSEYMHKFDFAIARAVCQLHELIALSMNFLVKRTQTKLYEQASARDFMEPNPPALIAFKGGDLTKEIDLARRRFPKVEIIPVDLTFEGSEQLIASDKKVLVVHI
jgi:16S rRNA (guanine(527)-N(7))-methyltransferase RsmG